MTSKNLNEKYFFLPGDHKKALNKIEHSIIIPLDESNAFIIDNTIDNPMHKAIYETARNIGIIALRHGMISVMDYRETPWEKRTLSCWVFSMHDRYNILEAIDTASTKKEIVEIVNQAFRSIPKPREATQ